MYKSPCVSYNRGMNRHPFHTCPYLNRSPHSDPDITHPIRILITVGNENLYQVPKPENHSIKPGRNCDNMSA